jgi:CDP-glucose 4,6-dehydratase
VAVGQHALEGLVIDPAFWRGRRVFLTGHTGFKGGWLALWLQQLGAQLSGYALPPLPGPSLHQLAGIDRGMNSHFGDLADLGALSAAMRAARPEVVLHLAAQPLVRAGYDDPVGTYRTNVLGTAHLLEAVRANGGVRAVLIVTTDKCYANREWLWPYREDDALGGHDPYSSSKACAELLTQSYRDSFFPAAAHAGHGVAVATARAGNVIGGGDWAADRLVPDVLQAFAAGKPVLIRNPHAVRPWQHVLEPLAGYLVLAERLHNEGPACAEAWNFGPDEADARPVRWLVERLAALWGEGAAWQADATLHPHEAGLLRLDCSKAHARLAWHPRLHLGTALEWTVEWFRAYRAGGDMHAVCLDQIKRYYGAEHS